ncbi:extracellular solute-binding protein [Pseudoglutamicibacter albus]|uniref:extracellular solute-binding protein n=1 Tax=Pseudoglutamicibacter albus TaxID=98671 RepID=UPI00361411C8
MNIDDTCIDQVEYAGVLKNAKNPDGAKAFVDFMLSEDMQNAIPEQMYMYPVNPDVKLPKDWAAHAPLSKTSVTPDPSEIAQKREEWIKQFRELSKNAK